MLWLIVCQIFPSERGVPHFNCLAVSPANIAIDISLKSTFFDLYFYAAESVGISSTTYT